MKALYFKNISPYEIGDKIKTKINDNVIDTKIIDIISVYHVKNGSNYFLYELEGVKGLVRLEKVDKL